MGASASITQQSPRRETNIIHDWVRTQVDRIVETVSKDNSASKYISHHETIARPPTLQIGSSQDYVMSQSSNNSLISAKSLRALAFKHHSRQENKYIPQETVLSISRGLSKKMLSTVNISTKLKTSSSGSLSSARDKSSGSMRKSPAGSNNSLVDPPSDAARKKPNLKISIQDDIDWIQVRR